MKTWQKIMILLFCMSLCVSCLKDEVFEEPQPDLKKASTKIYPSTETDVMAKAEEDWNNINEALQNAGPGEMVQLAEGLFYLHKSIIRWDFNGTLKGAGMDKTTIQTMPGALFDVSECPPLNWSFDEHDGFFMFCFAHHYNTEMRTVAVSDLKIIVDQPTTPYFRLKTSGSPEEGNVLQALHVRYDNLDNDLDNPVNLNVVYKNLAVIGVYDPDTYGFPGYSLFTGLAAFGSSSGIFEAKNVHIENAGTCILAHVFNGANSTITLKNSTINNCFDGIYSFLSNCWIVMNNEFGNNVASVFLDKYRGRTDVVLPSGKTVVKDNSLSLSMGAGLVGIQVNNAEVKNNVIYGQGYSGIYAPFVENWTIKDNDFCGVVDPIFGGTIFMVNPMNVEVKNNFNQSVVGPGVVDNPSLLIGEGLACED